MIILIMCGLFRYGENPMSSPLLRLFTHMSLRNLVDPYMRSKLTMGKSSIISPSVPYSPHMVLYFVLLAPILRNKTGVPSAFFALLTIAFAHFSSTQMCRSVFGRILLPRHLFFSISDHAGLVGIMHHIISYMVLHHPTMSFAFLGAFATLA